MADIDQLRQRWETLFRGMGDDVARVREFDALVAGYTEPHRGYHGLDHIEWCLREFDTVRRLARNPLAIEAAIWFHDVVYNPRGSDNEGASARVADAALARIGASASLRAEVTRLVLLTRHDVPPTDLAGQLMVDVDLSPLAAPPEVFDQNGRDIRREFSHVDDVTFDRSRNEILHRFAARPRIFLTDVFFQRYERAARENLRRALHPA